MTSLVSAATYATWNSGSEATGSVVFNNVSGAITAVTITDINKISTGATYTHDGTNWDATLPTGISITGTPGTGDTITVTYTAAVPGSCST